MHVNYSIRGWAGASNNDPARAAIDRYLLQTLLQWLTLGQTDGRTLDRIIDPAPNTTRTGRTTRSTQPCIPPGSLNRVPASAGVRAGMSPLPSGR